ncbi:arginine deiminase family protein [Shimazuella sp. AN120528]|uniref:dimethylarginine dimethylaminohydrolase family protein n=1 Tax=Shimazuella soli TaxID=1892854 RepID=UPI001F1172B6|nr:arginine deiminase family protein [Shimazuella soli]MCH5583527.1 arginine deiminase family protein [Shimazuella soli]
MVGSIERIMVKHPKDAFISQEHLEENWRKFNYIRCPDYEEAVQEYDKFLAVLKKHVPEIHFLPKNDTVGLDSIYTHDPVKITKKGAILLKSGKYLRRPEAGAIKDYFNELSIPILGEITGEGRVDGGDVVWFDERTLVVGRGYRTNEEGIRQLRELTQEVVDEFIVVHLPHGNGPEECLHLMSFISFIDHDLAVVYSKLMPVVFRELLITRGVKLLEVSDQEYDNLGCNILAISPRKCMMVAGNPQIKQLLEEEGVEVLEYKGEEISYLGTGGPTCLTSPVLRR